MAIENGYADLPGIKTILDIDTDDTSEDAELEDCVETASRDMDALSGKGRKFWQDSDEVARYYYPCDSRTVWVDDFATTADQFAVSVDLDDDGTFETTLTLNTDYICVPVNATADGKPWEGIQLLDGTLTGFERLSSGRPSVRVTAKFGWASVPEAVKRATLLQAKLLFKADDTTFGSFQMMDGLARRVPKVDPVAQARMEPFVRYNPVDDGA